MIREFLFPYYQQLISSIKERQIDKSRHLYFQVDTDGWATPTIPIYQELAGDGEPFCDRETDKVLFDAIKANLKEGITVVEVDNNINDPEFSAKAVEMMLDLIKQVKK